MSTRTSKDLIRLVNVIVMVLVMVPLFFGGIPSVKANTLVVGPGQTYTTIQAAVDAANAGDTVEVKAGTYAEQVTIEKDLTLVTTEGAVIQAFDSMTQDCTSPSLPENRPIVCVNGGAIVTIDGFVIDGASKGDTNVRLMGIAFRNAGGVVQHNTIQNIRFSAISSKSEGVGIYLYNSDTTGRTFTVSENTIQNFNKNGITLTTHTAWNPITYNILGNTITGIYPNSTVAQNGIQVEAPYGIGTISGNTITNIAYNNAPTVGDPTKAPLVAVSILNLSSNMEVSNNTITGTQVGMVFQSGGGIISGNTIQVIKPGTVSNPGRNMYGILAGDRALNTLSPIDPPVGGLSLNAVISGDQQLDILNNTITYNGTLLNTNTYGIEIDAGYSADMKPYTIIGNQVGDVGKGFDKGIGLLQCDLNVQADCLGNGYFASSVIQNNNIYNNLYGVYFTGPIPQGTFDTFDHNRIFGNTTAGVVNNTGAGIIMQNNWWGCNGGPDTTGCDSTVNVLQVDYDPWLTLTAELVPPSVPGGNPAVMTANLNINSDLVATGGTGFGPVNTTAAFTASLGSFNPTSAVFASGTATSTYTAPLSGGADSACVTVDSQPVCLDVPAFAALITSMDLLQSTDATTWTPVSGTFAGGYTMFLDTTVPWYYLDVDNMVSNRTVADDLYPFYVDTYPAGFFTYWAGRGVVGTGPYAEPWMPIMWEIINGNLPIFYLEKTASGINLVDGLQYAASGGALKNPLRIDGTYLTGAYTFSGTVKDTLGFDNTVPVAINFVHFPSLSSSDLTGPYTALFPQEFHVTLDNANGAAFSNVLVKFRMANTSLTDIASLEYWEVQDSSWHVLPLTVDGTDLIGSYGPPTGFPMPVGYNATSLFRITFNTAKTYNVKLTLLDVTPDPAHVLATLDTTAVVNAPTFIFLPLISR